MHNTTRLRAALLSVLFAVPAAVMAEGVNITPEIATLTVETAAGPVEIARIQDQNHELSGEWARTSRACPNFCIQPMVPAPGVTPVGELEMLGFLQDPDVVVIDGRVPPDFQGGAIPGAINVPYTEAADRLGELGCEPDFEGFDCTVPGVKSAALYCNGPWCGQSPTAARRMIEAGFPAEKIFYYRGGMQAWRMLGLTVTE